MKATRSRADVQALDRTQPLVARLGVLPLGVEVGRQVVVAAGGVGVVVGEQAAADLQRLLEERLGLRVLPLGVEVGRQVVVARGGVGVVVGEQAAADLQRFLVTAAGPAAYFPWALRLDATLL